MKFHHLIADRITKTFGLHKANDEVELYVEKGSIHAVLGENGAGKTTLMNIIYGLYQPDKGRILYQGRSVVIESPRTALALGIGMVHQEFMLVDSLTVTENVLLGSRERGFTFGMRDCEQRLRGFCESFQFEVALDQPVWRLPVGMQQRAEILKLLYRNVETLILDEPTSVLSPPEVKSFFQVLRRLKEAGKSILLVTHKLEEVMEIADKVTVMRDGRIVNESTTSATNSRELARLMVGRDVVPATRAANNPGSVVLSVKELKARNDRNLEAVQGISFDVREQEIFGIAGVDGNGQTELAEVLGGLRPASAGKILLDGKDVADASIRDRRHFLRIGLIPEDRLRVGLVAEHSVALNLVLRNFYRPPFSYHGYLNLQAVRAYARRVVREYDVRLRDINQPVRDLSGGNQQKLVLARELDSHPRLLIACQPGKGLDIGAIEFVHKTLLGHRNQGGAIIYISTELEQILAICDRIAVMYRGNIAGIITPGEATPEKLGMLMTGTGGQSV